jgi:two-component system chemotaxis sensor kinase CheA
MNKKGVFMNDENLNELLKYYFEEAYQIIDQLEKSVLELEKDFSNKDIINEIFRNAHTLKGSSGSMGFKEISEFAHIIEDSFDYLRGQQNVVLNSEIIDILLESVDIIKNMIQSRNDGKVYENNNSEIIEKIHSIPSLASKDLKNNNKIEAVKKEKQDESFIELIITSSELEIFKNQIKPGFNLYKIIVEFNDEDPMAIVGPLQIYSSLRDLGIILKTSPTLNEMNQDKFYKFSTYLVISDKDKDSIKKFIDIPDIVSKLEIIPVTLESLQSFIKDRSSENNSFENKSTVAEFKELKNNENIDNNTEEKISSTEKFSTKEEIVNNQNISGDFKGAATKASTILRVDSSRIDELLNLVSQIVINKAALIEYASKIIGQVYSFDILSSDSSSLVSYLSTILDSEEDFVTLSKSQIAKIMNLLSQSNSIIDNIKNNTNFLSNELQVYSRTVNLLQEGVMKIRMVPIEQMLSRFPRIIRDLSKKLNKEVEIIMEGEDTELDKSIIEELSDPVMHILRNCMDHGIEDVATRESLGKKRKGTIKISAKNEGNIIKISIEDDGSGINAEKVRKKAIEKKLIGESRILSMQEIYDLLFTPGFSTADKVSDVSGRGVGLDVVKKALENLNGGVQIESEPKKFTRFIIKIPLTLAIIQALLVYVADEIYALPISNIIETKRIYENEIIKIEGKNAVKIREEYISVIFLNEIFNLAKDGSKNYSYLVVVGVQDKKIGLVVDSLIGSQDIVIKPLKNSFTKVPSIAGSAILGNGAIALIIDINQLILNESKNEISEIDINSKI